MKPFRGVYFNNQEMILNNGMFKCGCYNTGLTRNQCRQMFYWKPLKRLVTTLASHYCVCTYRSRSISRFCITYPTPFTKTSHRELTTSFYHLIATADTLPCIWAEQLTPTQLVITTNYGIRNQLPLCGKKSIASSCFDQ